MTSVGEGPRAETPRGWLDFASRKLISGWALPNRSEGHSTVDITVDDEHFATVVANCRRPDLEQFGRTDVGFVVPADLPRDERAIVVTARVRGDADDLPGSPCRLPPISQVAGVDNPDWYREQTRRFLQWRFDEAGYFYGVYNGHQPLYGFGILPCEIGWLERYTITHAIMTELAGVDFKTLADIGGAEGYKGAMIRDHFGAHVVSADLSSDACALAERIYGLETREVTMERLPFDDDSVDVVLCSESLEHVSQPGLALAEMRRVARLAVLLTVPAEPLEQFSASVQSGDPHAHVNWFDLNSFDHLSAQLHAVHTRGILNTDPNWRQAGSAAEALVRRFVSNDAIRAGARAMTSALLQCDQAFIADGAGFNGMVALLEKRPCRRAVPHPAISIDRMLDFSVGPIGRPR